MKKILVLIVIGFTTFWGCNESTKEATPRHEIKAPALPMGVKQWGQRFAENLGSTIKKDIGLTTTLNSIKINSIEKSELFKNSISHLSLSQLKIFRILANARVESKSYLSFSKRLEEICNDIGKTVPQYEQEELFYMVAALYYGLKEIDNLIKAGTIIYRAIRPVSRLQSETIEIAPSRDDWWNDSAFLANVWALAIVEPTPVVGEAIAIALTAVVAAYLIVRMIENFAYCVKEFENCRGKRKNYCSDCLRYCMTQGVWNCD